MLVAAPVEQLHRAESCANMIGRTQRMGNARVTIGLPFCNAERTLGDAVRSIFAQRVADWRLLLVDDGSKDRSLEIAGGIRDPRVCVLSDGANRGLAHRLNQITGLAESEFVARMDADDLMHPDRLFRQISSFEEFPDLDVVGTATYTIDAHSVPIGRRGDRPVDPRISSVIEHGLLIHSSVMARSAWMRKHPYSIEYPRAEDCELWCRVCREARIANIATPLLFYREGVPFNRCAYLKTCESKRRVIRRYGPDAVGYLATAALVLKTAVRECVYRLARPARLQSALLRRRSAPLSAEERAAALRIIASILATPVPGLPDGEGEHQRGNSCTELGALHVRRSAT
jgi:glycosyltransferase involved in cell wall biosynthesis